LCEDQSAEAVGEDSEREEEALMRGDPAFGGSVESASGDDAVDMGVVVEVASPGVQDGGDGDLATEEAGIGGEITECAAGRAHEDGVDLLGIVASEQAQGVGDGEDDVEGADGEETLGACSDPAPLGQCLALGAVAVAAGVVDGGGEVAVRAEVEVAAERSGATARDVGNRATLLAIEGVECDELPAMLAEEHGEVELTATLASTLRQRTDAGVAEQDVGSGLRLIEGAADLGDQLRRYLRVASRGRGGAMPEYDLNDSHVGAALEEVSGKGVPQRMRGHSLLRARARAGAAHRRLQCGRRDVGERQATGKEEGRAGTDQAVVGTQNQEQPRAERHVASASALAAADVDDVALAVDVSDAQRAGLAKAQAGGVHRGQRGAVDGIAHRCQHRFDLGARGDLGQRRVHARPRDAGHHLGAAENAAVEKLQRRHVHLHARWPHPAVFDQMHEVGTHLVNTDGHRGLPDRVGKVLGAAKVLAASSLAVVAQKQQLLHLLAQSCHETPPEMDSASARTP